MAPFARSAYRASAFGTASAALAVVTANIDALVATSTAGRAAGASLALVRFPLCGAAWADLVVASRRCKHDAG